MNPEEVRVPAELEPADLGASKPIPQSKPKQRPLYLPTVIACGHKLEVGHFPKHPNCEHCWFALFETTPDGVESVHDMLMKEGTQAVRAMHGSKFLKAFGAYLRKKLLQDYASKKVQAASGIEGSHLEVPTIRIEGELQ